MSVVSFLVAEVVCCYKVVYEVSMGQSQVHTNGSGSLDTHNSQPCK